MVIDRVKVQTTETGKVLVKLYAARGWTRTEAARKTFVTAQTLRHWEVGLNKIKPYAMDRLKELWQLTPEELDELEKANEIQKPRRTDLSV